MKTILIVSHHTNNWGAERSTSSFAAYLQSKGYKVYIIIPTKGNILELLQSYKLPFIINYFRCWIYYNRRNYIKIILSSMINTLQLIRLIRRLKKNNIQPDIIYSNTLIHGFGILLSKYFNIPHIQHIRENIDVFGMKFNWGYNNTIKYIGDNSDKIICTCAAIKERYSNDIPENKIKIVNNGVPICDFQPQDHTVPIFKTIFMGRLDEDKRPQDVFHAIKLMVDNGFIEIKLDVYGIGTLEDELKAFISENNLESYISMKGFKNNVPINHYCLGFMSSTYEAFARSTLEYMMNGLAVLGANSGGTKEQIIHGVTGYLYEAKNANDLYNYLHDLYLNKDKCLQFGLNGRKRVITTFSQDMYVNNMFECLKEF